MTLPTPTLGTPAAPIVFLHIPKTAGQTVHAELKRVVGEAAVSPVRVHTQVNAGVAQVPPGYGLYSGHIDWEALETLPDQRFVFTVLRDPRERIASFYFFLLREARTLQSEELAKPERAGANMILNRSADDYFFGGDADWQTFVLDHYNNVYCSYLMTRKIRGWSTVAHLPHDDIVEAAFSARTSIDRIYSTQTLHNLEADMLARTGQAIRVADRYVNAGPDAGPDAPAALRWPKLCALLERDSSQQRLDDFTRLDDRLLDRLGLSGQACP